MSDWKERLRDRLEPILRAPDPRPQISAYHDMPFGIFLYPPEEEFALRRALDDLAVRLRQTGKRVTRISLSECLHEAVEKAGVSNEELAAHERTLGTGPVLDTIREIASTMAPLEELLLNRVPADASPERDVVFLERAAALYPMYRTSALMERLQGRLSAPAVLFYPGTLDGPAGLRFMGVLEAEHNYRPRIF
jgi:hypothetical protein